MIFVIAFVMLLFTGCSFKSTEIEYEESYDFQSTSLKNTLNKRFYNMVKNKRFKSANNKRTVYKSFNEGTLNQALYNFYKNWAGVPYQFGGNSKNGVDCSAFTQRAYAESFDVLIPRTTSLQARLGIEIDKSQLEMGDLVFFRTGINDRHVGIYIQNGMFMHASTKIGVTISSLNNNYFYRNYWKSQRLIY